MGPVLAVVGHEHLENTLKVLLVRSQVTAHSTHEPSDSTPLGKWFEILNFCTLQVAPWIGPRSSQP